MPGGGGSTTGGQTNPTPAPVVTSPPPANGGGTNGGSEPAPANNPYYPLESSDIKLLIGSTIVGNTVSTIYEPAPDGNNSLNKPTTIKLTASVLLNNLTSDNRAKWESRNKLVATVDANGLVTAVGRGRTEIVARPADDLSYPAGFTVPTAQAIIEVKAIGAVDLVVE
ncbi:MAG: Ig-like domain-containing protein [Candidatus Sericytochromatia bacterium]|nr:Ig-like domain-containing protein [Candidatus Sericytochromatia bacterium]